MYVRAPRARSVGSDPDVVRQEAEHTLIQREGDDFQHCWILPAIEKMDIESAYL